MGERATLQSSNPRSRVRAGPDGPTDKERDYLEILYYLTQDGQSAIAAELGRWLGLQSSTVSHALQQLLEKRYIERDERGAIRLTPEGGALAEEVVRRQRILERFLTDVLGVAWHLAHQEAVRIEHAVSPLLIELMSMQIGTARTCPHGNPIPRLDAEPAHTVARVVPLTSVAAGSLFTLRRIAEEAEERADLLRYLELNGILPGNQFLIPDASALYGTTLRRCNHDITVSADIAAFLWGEISALG